MKEKNDLVIFKEQKVGLLKILWNKFFENIHKGWPSVGNHNWSRLVEIKNESMGLFDSYEQAPELLLEHIRQHEDVICSIAKVGSSDALRAIKEICELIQQNAPTDFFLYRYGIACWHLYGA